MKLPKNKEELLEYCKKEQLKGWTFEETINNLKLESHKQIKELIDDTLQYHQDEIKYLKEVVKMNNLINPILKKLVYYNLGYKRTLKRGKGRTFTWIEK